MFFFMCFCFPARDSHITQLAAVCGGEKFSTYILSRKPITRKASEITGIEVVNGKMFCRNKEVNAVNISDGMDLMHFLTFYQHFRQKLFLLVTI